MSEMREYRENSMRLRAQAQGFNFKRPWFLIIEFFLYIRFSH